MAPGGSGGRVNDRGDARTGERLECAGLALGRLGATAMRDRSGGCVTKEHAGWVGNHPVRHVARHDNVVSELL
jgi:hypothetical protein